MSSSSRRIVPPESLFSLVARAFAGVCMALIATAVSQVSAFTHADHQLVWAAGTGLVTGIVSFVLLGWLVSTLIRPMWRGIEVERSNDRVRINGQSYSLTSRPGVYVEMVLSQTSSDNHVHDPDEGGAPVYLYRMHWFEHAENAPDTSEANCLVAGIPTFRFHDLRRCAETLAESAGAELIWQPYDGDMLRRAPDELDRPIRARYREADLPEWPAHQLESVSDVCTVERTKEQLTFEWCPERFNWKASATLGTVAGMLLAGVMGGNSGSWTTSLIAGGMLASIGWIYPWYSEMRNQHVAVSTEIDDEAVRVHRRRFGLWPRTETIPLDAIEEFYADHTFPTVVGDDRVVEIAPRYFSPTGADRDPTPITTALTLGLAGDWPRD